MSLTDAMKECEELRNTRSTDIQIINKRLADSEERMKLLSGIISSLKESLSANEEGLFTAVENLKGCLKEEKNKYSVGRDPILDYIGSQRYFKATRNRLAEAEAVRLVSMTESTREPTYRLFRG